MRQRQVLQVHAQFIVHGIHSAVSAAYACLPINDIFLWNTLIRLYSRTSHSRSLLLYKSMLAYSALSPNNFTFPFLLTSCSHFPTSLPARSLHSHVIKYGFCADSYISNSLIHLYSVFGHLDAARQVFNEIRHRTDLVSFNTLIGGYARGGRPAHALHLFREMWVLGINPDEFTLVALLSVCSALHDSKIGMQVHLLMYKALGVDDVTFNEPLKCALINMYAKCGLMECANRVFCAVGTNENVAAWSSMVSGYAKCGEIDTARRLFDEMPERDVVSWTTMIGGYCQAGRYNEALKLFIEMEGADVIPDEITMVTVLSACAQLGALDFGKKIHRYIQSRSFDPNVILVTAIVDMYAKCGSIECALEVFYSVPENSRNIFLFNSIISGLAQHGLFGQAMRVFREMQSAGQRPDGATFVGLLNACSHGGHIEEGEKLFDSMVREHGIDPQVEHYGCMVDLLGRGGYLKEAHDFIEKMPIEANSVIWGILLSACRVHKNVEMAEVVGERLLQLDACYGGCYVLLSSIYTSSNRWDDARRVRKQMEDRGIQKPPGWSYLELNGSILQFLAGDISSPQAKEVNLMLEEMARQLRFQGYVPSTMLV